MRLNTICSRFRHSMTQRPGPKSPGRDSMNTLGYVNEPALRARSIQLHLRYMIRYDQLAGGLLNNLLDTHPGGTLLEYKRAVLDLQVGAIREYPVNAASTGQRPRAVAEQVGVTGLGSVGHGADDVPGPRHEIHGAAHALDQLAGNHP